MKPNRPTWISRRHFVESLAVGAFASALPGTGRAARVDQGTWALLLGICSSPDRAAALKAAGFEFIECGVAAILKPDTPDDAFAGELPKLKACELPIRSCNGFIPAKFRLTGPDTTHDAALAYAVVACRRAEVVGISYIVFGSGAARKVPAGFDPGMAKQQFIGFCRKLAERIADLKVTIVLEPLNKQETNLLNSVAEGIDYVDAINHPRIQLLADFYHMRKENESPDAIRKAGRRIRHCHIAELKGRMAPGTAGEDLSGFFMALRDIGYTGGVSCEAGWPRERIEEAWRKAIATMRAQAGI